MSDKSYKVDMDLTPEQAADGYSVFLKAVKNNLDPNSNTVLLIDDERGIRRKVARDVRGFDDNLVIVEAANGKEGLEKLAEIRKTHTKDPLFIVLDLNMPVMDGWTFLEHLKKEYQEQGKACGIPVLILSSTSGEKGILFTKKSVHNTDDGYTPLVTIAKEVCIDGAQYDAEGDKGLMAWLNIIAIIILFFMGKPALKALQDYEKQRKAGVEKYTFDPQALGIEKADFWEKKIR